MKALLSTMPTSLIIWSKLIKRADSVVYSSTLFLGVIMMVVPLCKAYGQLYVVKKFMSAMN